MAAIEVEHLSPVTLAVLGACTVVCAGLAARVFRWDS